MSTLLRVLGVALAFLIPTTWRLLIWILNVPDARIFYDFRSVFVVAADFALGLFLLAELLRFMIDPGWRESLLRGLGDLGSH